MAKTHADYEALARKTIDSFGKTNGSKLPESNDPTDAALQRYAMISMLKKHAESEEKKARAEVLKLIDSDKLGKSIVHDSTFAVLTADVRRGASRLDTDKLISEIAKRYRKSVNEVMDLIESCKTHNANSAILSVTLKQ